MWSALSWGKAVSVDYGDLRPRLLLHAEEDLFEVETNSEIRMPPTEKSVPLKLSKFKQKGIFKGHYYRVIYTRSYDTYGVDPKKSNTVYELTLVELNETLQPTGVELELSAKANPDITISNFTQIKDQLSNSETLKTGRAQVGDQVINALPTVLNNQNIPAYTRFDVIGISKEYIPFTLAHKYILNLRDVRTKKVYTLGAPGLRELFIWALVVAPQNERIIRVWGIEAHY